MTDHKLVRIDSPDDPDRCQGVDAHGQCQYKKCEDADYCGRHGGPAQSQAAEKKRISNYRLLKFQAKLDQMAENPTVKSLRDEVAILRILMEERLNKCKDDSDLLMQSHTISDLVMKIDRLVTSCHKLEGSMGQLLDKPAIMNFATEIVNLISRVLEGEPEKIDEIADGIMAAVGRIGGDDDEN